MRNYRKLFAIILVAGVLLGGFGAGVALVEYSSLTFVGRQTVGQVEMTTEDFTVELPATITPDHRLYLSGNYYDQETERSLKEDESIPEGTLTVRITYNRNLIEPEVLLDDDDDEDCGILRVWGNYTGPSDLALLLTFKDQILEDLKHRRLSEYDTTTIENITFLIHPKDRDRLIL